MKPAVVTALVLSACVDSGPGPQGKKIDPIYVQAHLLAKAPADLDRFDLKVGDALIYLGNKVEKPRTAPGQAATITHYWKVLAPIGDRFAVFAQVRGAGGTADFMNLTPTDMEIGHGPATWQTGEIIEDIQTFTLRPDWKSNEATVYVGLIENRGHATLDRMAVAGPRTRDRAIIAHKIEVDLAHAPPPRGTAYIQRALGAITVDGGATDPGWVGIPSADLVTAEGGQDPIGKATAKLTWDDDNLYAFVSVTDSDITSPYKKHDDPLWQGDCIELFIDADGNRSGYIELQVSPNNVTFDKWYATTRAQPGDESWDSGMVTAVKLRGSADEGDSGDTGWDVEIAIPWAAVKGKQESMNVRLPPTVGDKWRLNLVRVDRKTGGKPNEMTASSWNKITMADFHALDRMLVGVFADTSGSVAPRPPGAGSGSGSAGSGSAGSAAGSGSGSGSASIGTISTPGIVIPNSALDALRRLQTLDLEILATGTRFASVVLGDDQLTELLHLAAARSRATEIRLSSAPAIRPGRINEIADRARQIGFTKVTIVNSALAPAGGSGSAVAPRTGSGSAVAPKTGSGSASTIVPKSPVGSGSATIH